MTSPFTRSAADTAVVFANAAVPARFPHASPQDPVPAHVFDMDGTLTDVTEIARTYLDGPKAAGRPKDFHGFHSASADARPNQEVLDALLATYESGIPVLVVTARMSDYVAVTVEWLRKHGAPFDRIYMRAHNDFRPDQEVKAEIHEAITADGFTVAHAWDDNPAILTLWASLGIPTTAIESHMYAQPGEPT